MLIDTNRLNSLYDSSVPDEVKWFYEMITTLQENMKTRLENIKNVIPQQNYPQLQKELHQIKGMSLNFGLIELGKVSTEAEALLKSDKVQEAFPLIDSLGPLWENTRKDLLKATEAKP